MKQENVDSESDSVGSDEEMEAYTLDDKNKNIDLTLATAPLISQTKKQKISIKVIQCIKNCILLLYYFKFIYFLEYRT